MRKEVVFAIIIGILFGLVLAYGIIRANKAINRSATSISTENKDLEEPNEPTPPRTLSITLTEPEDSSVITENPITVSGITKPNLWVVTSTEDSDSISFTENQGAFSNDIDLVGGLNFITITAIEPSGLSFEKIIKIVFSSEFTPISTKSSGEAATESGKSQESSVNEKIENVLNKPRFYSGTITDISNGSIQIKGDAGEIKLISASETKTVFIKLGKTSTKIKMADVAIGDYIIAMGYIKDKGVLDSSRILIASPSQPTKRKVLIGKVMLLDKNSLNIKSTSDDKVYSVEPGDGINITKGALSDLTKIKFTQIKAGDDILLTGSDNETVIEATRIHIISTPEATPTP
ncbi:hypothetical protein A3A76_02390 [Candidatus Woesebacteria bacterium RIFCSPLOWO2_01_FULL_39_23]|uniref:DUF5666 domain-containing protein n=1 Tax=Candidatus Woesebacteria bacterium RIFCSPHIGHO2_01_FULL_40_22 TaxID=1802499 RepID=A0A1F7YJ01_9BACT|nr:MAG: hypothetical protein A2628_00795 [Candidatus Woesebacteria bacterium RIFCSPHIGHO2_01_FULL_40_22]OGM62498.1 MAG: hypothetical protein A3A76_02390 [Candidatus Woesebacteria bacterium RIFCSPLOWO2_01_FULL_39_23]